VKALSIRQPWAWLIVAGYKTVENRTWATSHRGPLLIHASRNLAFDPATMTRFRQTMAKADIVIPDDLVMGGVIGIVDVIDCTLTPTDPTDADWHEPEMWAWVLRNPRPLTYLPVPGRLQIFDVQYPAYP